MGKSKRFKVHSTGYTVPWNLLQPHEAQALKNHDQTLERLNERGGLDWKELYAVIQDKDCFGLPEWVTDEYVKRWLGHLVEGS